MLRQSMRSALGLVVALMASACVETAPPPRVVVRDTFPVRFAAAERAAPPARPVRSVSLGFIGDGPIGTEPTPPFHLPYWERPFPCEWTNTCWLAPPPLCPCGGPP
jgi:hypothetical protein